MTDPNLPAPPVDRLTLFGIPTTLTPQQAATLRQSMTVVATIAGTLGLISTIQANELIKQLTDLGGAISGVVTAIATAVIAYNHVLTWYRASFGQQSKNVAALPNTMVVKTSPAVSDVDVADNLSKVPGVTVVLTDQATANAAPSPKVISPQ